MSYVFDERRGSPRIVAGSNATEEYLYNLWEDDPGQPKISEDDAEAYVAANTDAAKGDLTERVIVLTPDDELGDKLWRVEVRYSRPTPTSESVEPGGSAGRRVRIGFDRQRLYRSISTIQAYAADGETAPDFGKMIGVTQNGVEGVDVITPAFKFTRHRTIDASAYNDSYENVLYNVVGRVNKTPFTGKASGTVLLVGVDSQYNPRTDEYELTFEFEASPNQLDISVGGITGITKGGWEYLWVYYEDVEDEASGRTIKKPVAAYREQIYQVGDFSVLGF